MFTIHTSLLSMPTESNKSSDSELHHLSQNALENHQHRIKRPHLLLGCGIFASTITYVLFSFVSPAFRRICLPYLPATTNQLEKISNLLHSVQSVSPYKTLGSVIDLGSGDGRVLIHLIRQPGLNIANAYGVELNRPLVWYSRLNRFLAGVNSRKLTFRCADLWTVDLSSYQTLLLFGVDGMMESLEKKVTLEAARGSILVSCRFPLPNRQPDVSVGVGTDAVYLYHL